jgi:hypothetical protein
LNGVQGVAGSNPAVPTKQINNLACGPGSDSRPGVHILVHIRREHLLQCVRRREVSCQGDRRLSCCEKAGRSGRAECDIVSRAVKLALSGSSLVHDSRGSRVRGGARRVAPTASSARLVSGSLRHEGPLTRAAGSELPARTRRALTFATPPRHRQCAQVAERCPSSACYRRFDRTPC